MSTGMHSSRRGRIAVLLAVSAPLLCGLGACSSSGKGSTTTVPAPSAASTPAGSPADGSPRAGASPSKAPNANTKPVPVESNPPGDIPDNLAFVPYQNKPGGYAFTHPEGWARTGAGTRVTFTDKLNGVTV